MVRRCYDELEDHEDESDVEHEKLRNWAAGMMEENERLRAEMGDAEGRVRALRRRQAALTPTIVSPPPGRGAGLSAVGGG